MRASSGARASLAAVFSEAVRPALAWVTIRARPSGAAKRARISGERAGLPSSMTVRFEARKRWVRGEGAEELGRAVGAAVVDDDQFEGAERLVQERMDGLREVTLAVEDRH